MPLSARVQASSVACGFARFAVPGLTAAGRGMAAACSVAACSYCNTTPLKLWSSIAVAMSDDRSDAGLEQLFGVSSLVALQRRLAIPGKFLEGAWREALWAVCLGWLPLLIICSAQSQNSGEGALGSFLTDRAIHARSLFATAILIVGRPISYLLATVALGAIAVARLSDPTPAHPFPPGSRGRLDIHQYGEVAHGIGQDFERKWLDRATPDSSARGMQDLSAVHDCYQRVGNVYAMRVLPIDPSSALVLAIATVLPILLAAATTLPFGEINDYAGRVLF